MKEEALVHAIKHWNLDCSSVLDLGCGFEGTIGKMLQRLHLAQNIEYADGSNGVTEVFEKKLKIPCYLLPFQDIGNGKMPNKRYSLVICSYALHFLNEKYLPDFMRGLQRLTANFLLICPDDLPIIPLEYWNLTNSFTTSGRTKAKLFKRKNFFV